MSCPCCRPVGSRARRGLSRVDLLFGAAAVAVIACVAVTMPMRGGGGLDSQYKLAELAQANECYANDFAGRQFGVMPADAGQYGDSCYAYTSAVGCVRPMIFGRDANGAYWGYFIPSTATCENGLGGAASVGTCGNWEAYRPINFSGAAAGYGSFAIPNVRGFREYLSRNFYSPEWYAEDDPTYAGVPALSTAESEFTFPAPGIPGGYQDSSYCFSPAAMFDPSVLRPRAEGGFRAPASFAHSYRAPAVAKCVHPSLKTRMCEYGWYRDEPSEGLAFNAGRKSAPYTLFFDGSVQSISMAHAAADDIIAREGSQSGDGLWSDDTPLGPNGWQPSGSVDGTRTSFHILTTGGIRGRDLLSRD
ncbi:MAG: hypothetical protein RLY21_1983 [Planctomycetota bacterium]